jgi:FADH2 O2-dependent halogenase
MLRNTHDVAIMGASIGGATLAAVLAKRGKRVVLVDAGLHPRFAVGEATTPHTTHSLSLLAEQHDMPEISPRRLFRGALRSRCGIKRNFGFVYHHPGEQPRLTEAQLSPVPSESHLFRQDTDQHLTALAASFGVEVMQQTRVEAVTLDDTAVRLKLASGRELVASFLVDASGFQSGLNPLLGLTRCEPDLETWSCSLFTHMVGVMPFDDLFPHSFSGRFHQGTLHHVFNGGWLWIIPFNNHRDSTNPLVSVGLQLDPRKVTPPTSEQAEEFFRDFIRQFPAVERQLACARTVRPWIVGTRLQHRERQAGGLRWCRLPSNYGFIDPIYSKGLSQTFDAIRLLSHELVCTSPERLGQLGETLGLDQYYEQLIRKHDRLAAGSYISFRDPQLWRQFWFTWFSTTVADELCLMATRIGRRRGETRGSQQSILSDHCFPEAEPYLERCFAVAQDVDQGKLSSSEATRRLIELNEQTHWMPPFARRFTQVSARPLPRVREVPETIRWLSSTAPHVRQVYRTLLSPRLAGLLV